MTTHFSTYQSPFTWRYGSTPMRTLWSEEHKYRLWRRIWVALAAVQQEMGLVSKKELADIKKHESIIDIARILELEKEIRHDVVAAINEFAEKAKLGSGKIHWGATSMDITDNAEVLRIRDSLVVVKERLGQVLAGFSNIISQYANIPCLGFTHLQPAEPTTIGYRLAFYAQDLLDDYRQLETGLKDLKTKGFKGAVGTAASYSAILNNEASAIGARTAVEMEKKILKKLGLKPFLITSQVYPRKQDYRILTTLAGIAASLSKFAADIRLLQSPMFGEWSEPFGKSQVGSSAMPFKRNPTQSENICSLARYVASLPQIMWADAAHCYLERTLDDSANRRIIIPEAFLAVDQMLQSTNTIVTGLVINRQKIQFNLQQYALFAATEGILLAMVKQGANRQQMHERLRDISMRAWEAIGQGRSNPMGELLVKNKTILKYIDKGQIEELLDVSKHVGDAPQRAKQLVRDIQKIL